MTMEKLPFKKLNSSKKRLKMMIYADTDAGKTHSIIKFPNSLIIDSEGGTENYEEEIERLGSKVINTNNFFKILEIVRWLKHNKHEFTTLSIDSSTSVVHWLRNYWSDIFDKWLDEKNEKQRKNKELEDYGQRYWSRVNATWARLIRELETLDMNIIFTAHEKDKYEGEGKHQTKVGITFDSGKNDARFFSYIFRIEKVGSGKDAKRTAICLRERALIGKHKFPKEIADWSYEKFCKYYDKELLERKAEYVKLATEEQLDKISHYITHYQIPEKRFTLWLEKANVESFAEMAEDAATKMIKFLGKEFDNQAEDK